MPRVRKPITPTLTGNVYLAFVKHPVLKKTICFSFGDATEAKANTDALNKIFMNPALWHNPPLPPETPDKMYRQWMGRGNTVKLAGKSLMRGTKPLKSDSAEVARLTTAVDALTTQLQVALDKIEKQERELETWRGKKTSKLPSPSLEKARASFMKAYKSGALSKKRGKIPDADAVKNIEWDLERFCKHFGETTPADFIEGSETKFSDWLHSLKHKGQIISASRRMQMRVYVLMMLVYAGAHPDRKKVIRPDTSESSLVNDTTKDTNGVINYLTRDEAARVLEMLPQPWADMFRIQSVLGLRPDELLTLHKNNFAHNLSKLTLAPLIFTNRYGERVTLTLKTGPRDIPIPSELRTIIKARLKKNAVVFTGPDDTARSDPKEFNRQFKAALVKAGKYPDCLDHPYLGPVFAPCHRFGYRNDFDLGNPAADSVVEDVSEPERGAAQSRARSWTCYDALLDNRRTFAPSSGGNRPPFPVDIGNTALPDDIVWPEGMGSVLGGARTLKAFSVEGESLRDGLQAILRKAGAYDLYVEPRGDGKSILTVLDMNPKSFTGIILKTPDTAIDVGDAVNSSTIVKSWKVDESFINGFDEVVIAGDGPCREGMVSTTAFAAVKGTDKPLTDSAPGKLFLEPAWSAADEFAFKTYIGRYDNKIEAFQQACKRWPLVYCAYRIRLGADIWSGTKWAGMQQGGYTRIQPFQLTGYQQDAANPRYWCPREIIVEYLDKYDDNLDPAWTGRTPKPLPDDPTGPADQWHEAGRYDNLTLSADGTMVMLPGLREQLIGGGSYTYVSRQTHDPNDVSLPHPNNNAYFGQEMRRREIRIQLAAIANFPLKVAD